MSLKFGFVIALVFQATSAARILGIFPHFGVTHWYVFRPLMEELAARGHQVTVLSPFPRDEPMDNYEDATLTDVFKAKERYVNLTEMESWSRAAFREMLPVLEMAAESEATLEQRVVASVGRRKFDVVILEFFNTDAYQALAFKIGAPVIGFSSTQISPWAATSLASPESLSISTHFLSFASTPLSFWGRLLNVVEAAAINVMYRLVFVPQAEAAVKKNLKASPEIAALRSNTTLALVNAHFTLNGPRPTIPNVIEVGGINVQPPKPLPEGLQLLLDGSKHGVIYFSMGTILRASTMSDQKREAFLKVFAGLKQTVLWKYDGDLKGKPSNVHTAKWFPQRDIFAHKNVVLFISHCGNLGVNEAVHEGIPIICIPMFGDQPYNSRCVEARGMGAVLDFFSELTYEKIKSTVESLLSNPSYSLNAKKVSKAYNDRPMTPLQTGVYWVEYVIRHKGAYHIRSPGRHMKWYEYHNYDVLLVLQALLFLFIYAIYKLLLRCSRVLSLCTNSKIKIKKA